jgi:hypothetical protein
MSSIHYTKTRARVEETGVEVARTELSMMRWRGHSGRRLWRRRCQPILPLARWYCSWWRGKFKIVATVGFSEDEEWVARTGEAAHTRFASWSGWRHGWVGWHQGYLRQLLGAEAGEKRRVRELDLHPLPLCKIWQSVVMCFSAVRCHPNVEDSRCAARWSINRQAAGATANTILSTNIQISSNFFTNSMTICNIISRTFQHNIKLVITN